MKENNDLKIIKENQPNKRKIKENSTNLDLSNANNKSLVAQGIMLVILGTLLIINMTNKQLNLEPYLDIVLAITMLILAYNNNKRFKRKYFTALCLLVAVVLFTTGIIGLFQ